jgi:ABC-type dipeptide/oligopeptide/nickel transport system ATPase component
MTDYFLYFYKNFIAMKRKLLIGVLGNEGAGKSTTWNALFGHTVHTGKNIRKLKIYDTKIPVFLINESALERKTKLEYIMPDEDPEIVISSFLYHKDVKSNFDYFIKRGYDIYVQWLNPGFSDPNEKALFYNEGIINYLLGFGATVAVKNGKQPPQFRVEEIKNMIFVWNLSQK